MTDKELIKADLDKAAARHKEMLNGANRPHTNFADADFIAGAMWYKYNEQCKQTEEPVSIDFEQELYKAFGQVKDFTLCMRIAKRFYDMGKKSREPVSEDLKKAAEIYAFTMSGEDEVLKHDAFIEGAQWQKQKDSMPVSEDLEEAVNAYIGYAPEVDESSSTYGKRQAFKAGAQWQKERLMAKAIDAKLLEGHLIRQRGVTHPLHVGDKVKVILIKWEEI